MYDDIKFSELMVLNSPAGFYIGRNMFDEEFESWMPGTRESGYFTKEDADHKLLKGSFEVRICMENDALYMERPDLLKEISEASIGE